MIYADVFFYKTEYFGEIDDDTELQRMLLRASEKVDDYTYNRSKNFDNLSDYEKEMIKKAVCAEADALYQFGEQDVSLGSYSIGDVSISNNTASPFSLLSLKAQKYLNNTNLTSRIL